MGSYYTGNAASSSYGSSYAQQSSYGKQSYGGGYQKPSSYNYNQTVTVPPLPYQNNQYQLPDTYQQGGQGYINNYYNQNAYFNDSVKVTDYYNVTPYHNREYIYGGVHASQSPLISTTSGYIPEYQAPSVNFSYGGGYGGYGGGYQQQTNYQNNYGGGGYMQNSMYAPGGASMTNQMWG